MNPVINIGLLSILEWKCLHTWSSLSSHANISYAITAFIVVDFVAYWYHRLLHCSRPLYYLIHAQHHEHAQPTFISTIYMHPLEIISFYLIYHSPYYLGVPFSSTTAILYESILIGWNFCNHGLESFHHHRTHHSKMRGNYASCLFIWDFLFGTVISL